MTQPAASTSPMLDAALSYAARGWPVFPLHNPVGKYCSCRSRKCDNPAKHPRTKNGLTDATTDRARIQAWWAEWPSANVGLRTGEGLVVLDIDPRAGGDESLSELERSHGALPETVEVVTGGGGRHVYLSCQGEIRNTASIVGQGLDVRGDGGYVVAPPSLHASGKAYEWEAAHHPDESTLAGIPGWLANLAIRRRARPSLGPENADKIIEGGRNEALFRMASGLRARGFSGEAILAAIAITNAERCVPPLDEAELRRIATSTTRYQPGTAASGDAPADDDSDDDWRRGLRMNAEGKLTKDVGNATLLLLNLPEWQGALGYDAFGDRVLILREPPSIPGLPTPAPGELRDDHLSFIHHWLAKRHSTSFSKDGVADAVLAAARANTHHPLQDYLDAVVWDGARRVDRWLVDYLGAPDTDYSKAVGRWWLIAAVARAYQPGCQSDHLLILEGPQGAGKSSAVRILAGDWYLGSLPDLRSKDAPDALNGHWLCEIGELDAFRGASGPRVKDFVTQRIDVYRPAYARLKVRRLRSVVFIGTTNDAAYLRDATGARRFWPVRVSRCDTDTLKRDRDQIWAEAREMFRSESPWWPSAELAEAIAAEQEGRYEADPWEELITDWLGTPAARADALTSKRVLSVALQLTPKDQNQFALNRVGHAMRRLGYDNPQVRHGGERLRIWARVRQPEGEAEG